jgi:NitT/TauT family transport system substrate-binding protein
MNSLNRRSWIAAAAAMPLALSGPRVAFAQGAPAVRVGDAIGDPYAQGYYAVEGGFFQKAGLNVDFQAMPGGTQIAQGVITGGLDIGIMTPLAIANAVIRGIPLVIIAAGGVNNAKAPSGSLIVAKNSPLHVAKNFEGKTVGLASLRTVHELMLLAWFEKNKLDPARLRRLELTFGEMGPAIERGTIDAAIEVDPLTSGWVKAGKVRVVEGPNSAIPEFLGAAWFSTADYANKNRDVVRRFAAVMADVAHWANAHQSESGDILAKAGKMDPAAVRGMVRCTYADTVRVAQIQPLLDAAARAGILSRQVAASELIFKA